MVKLLCAGATFITGRSTSARTTFTLRSQIHFPIQPHLPDMRLRKCWGVSNTAFYLCLYFQNLRYKSLSFIMISNWHTVMMVCVKSQTEEQQKKARWQIGKRETRMEEVSLFSLTSRSRMVAVRHLPLPEDHILNCHIKLQIATLTFFVCVGQVGSPDGKMLDRGAKWARVIFVNRNDPKP